ncbi:hypothetical protein D9M68_529660 [compost metagenome]
MHFAQLGFVQCDADAGQIDGLAAGHALAAGRARQQAAQKGLHGRGHLVALGGEQLEGQRLQRVAREQRVGFAELHVHGGLAAAQHVVVHARQVVVHQRIGVDEFGGAGRTQRGVGVAADRFIGREHQQRPQPLAAVEHGIAHGVAQQHRRIDADPARQRRFDRGQVGLGPAGQRLRVPGGGGGGGHRDGAHSAVQGLRLPASSTLIWSSTACSLSRQKPSNAAPRW